VATDSGASNGDEIHEPPEALDPGAPAKVAPNDAATNPDDIDTWRGSPEQRKGTTRAIILLSASVLLAGVSALFLTDEGLGSLDVRLVLGVIFGIFALGPYVGALLTLPTARARFREAQRQKLKEAQQRSAEQLQEGADVARLLEVSKRDMETYQILSQDQARGSYIMSLVSSGIGGLILVGGAVAAILISDTTNKVAVASLTALGGALSGYISRTFLRVYERSLLQLNFFFQVPLVSNYILTAERLTTKMSKDQRDSSYEKVVNTVLDISTRSISASESLVAQEASSKPAEASSPPANGAQATAV
jgi:hypothetical protein